MNLPNRFDIAGWRIEPPLNRISQDNKVIQLEPRVMQVLCKLAEKPGEVFTRGDLLDSVWVGMTVGEEALTRSISELRKAFDDDPKKPVVIETIYKTGYRLLAPVELIPLTGRVSKGFLFPPAQVQFGNVKTAILTSAAIAIAIVSVMLVGNFTTVEERQPGNVKLAPLTTLPGEEFSPSISADGKTVLFSWRKKISDKRALVSKVIATGERSILFSDDKFHYDSPIVSPDGKSIAFVRKGEATCDIFRLWIESKRLDNLTSCNQRSFARLAWRPDGNAIAVSDRAIDSAPYSIFELSLVDQSKTKLTTPPAHTIGDRHVSYSNDGKSVAFVRVKATGISDIFKKDLLTDRLDRVTFDETKIGGLAWREFDGEILFTSNRRGPWDLWAVDVNSFKTSMFSVGAEAYGLSYSADTKRVVFEKRSVDTNLWRIDLNNGETENSKFASSTRWDDNPSFSNSGEHLAFVSDRSGAPEIWIAEIASGKSRRVTYFDGGLVLRPRWSLDDKKIVFNARINGNADVYILSMDSGAIVRVTDHPAIDATPVWSHDGDEILYSSNRSGEWELWRTSAFGGENSQASTQGGVAPYDHRELDGVLHTRPGISGLWLLPNAKEEETKLVDAYSPKRTSSWTVSNNKIYFIDVVENVVALLSFDAESGKPTKIAELQQVTIQDLQNIDLTVSPNGEALILSKIDSRSSDLQLLELDSVARDNAIVAEMQVRDQVQ